MRHTYLALTLAALVCTPVLALETTSIGDHEQKVDITNLKLKQENDINAVIVAIGAINTCGAKMAFYKPADPLADVDGCVTPEVHIQTGRVTGPAVWEERTANITFNKPFLNTPNIYVQMGSIYSHGPCRSDVITLSLAPTNVTTTGFTLVLPAHYEGCGGARTDSANWIAVDPTYIHTQTNTASPPPPPPPGDGPFSP